MTDDDATIDLTRPMIEPSGARIIAEMRHYVACPACGEKAGRIDHLYSDVAKRSYRGQSCDAGPWMCEECGAGYRLIVSYDDVYPDLKPGTIVPRVTVERAPEHDLMDTLTLLRFPDADDAYLVVAGTRPIGEKPGVNEPYVYDEHTCPVNYLGPRVELVMRGDDTDPHGLFAHVGTIDRPADIDLDDLSVAQVRALFDSEIDWEVATGESYRDTLPDADDEPNTGPPPLVFDLQPSGLYTLRRG